MPTFRKRPVLVFAEQFTGGPCETWPEGVFSTLGPTDHGIAGLTEHGHVPVEVGDWIVTDGRGGRWRCPSGDFAAMYERVGENGPSPMTNNDRASAHLNSALECWDAIDVIPIAEDDFALLREHILEAVELLVEESSDAQS